MARQREDAGLVPRLGHPREIKRRIAGSSRTDETDSAGMLIFVADGVGTESRAREAEVGSTAGGSI
jgi:hypothetical protein